MLNFKKPVFAFSLAVLATQVTWAEPAKMPPVTAGMTILLDASDLNADGIVDPGSDYVDDNNKVNNWQNRSAVNGGHTKPENNFFPIADNKKPTWLGEELNGKAVISFKDGGLKGSSILQIPVDSNYTKFVAFKINDTSVPNNLISSDSTALWMGQAEGTANEKVGVLKTWHKPTNYLIDKNNKVIDTQNYHIATTRYAKGLPVLATVLPNVLRVDGSELAFNHLSKPFAESVIYIGAGTVQNKFLLSGEIAEAIVYNRALSNTEITKVEKYLKDKWGGFKANKITTFTIGSAKKEKGKTISLTGKASSNLPVIFESKSKPICKLINNKSVKLLAIGKCIITAGVVGNKTYRSAKTLVKDFSVVAVTTTPTESSGGGGSSTPMGLLLLGVVTFLRRKHFTF